MIKNLTGGALINYGPTFPDPASSYDGALFYKNSGSDQGLFIFSFNPDANLAVFGDQVSQGWYQATSTIYVVKTGDTMTGDLVIQSSGTYKGLRLLNSTTQSSGSIGVNDGSTAGINISSDTGPMYFFAGGSERLRITTTGQLINTTAAGAATVWTSLNDSFTGIGARSGPNASTFDNLGSAYYLNATNLNAGTIPLARLPFMPIQQGGGILQQNSKIYIGWSASGQLRLQVDVTDFGVNWPININGNAATANTAANATNAINATNAVSSQYVRSGGGAGGTAMTFTGTATAGAPAYLWGTNSGSASQVYSPSAITVGAATNANTVGGLGISSGINNLPSQIARTDNNGYLQCGWINTISGDNATAPITRVYASGDNFIRTYTPANFRAVMDLPVIGGNNTFQATNHFQSNKGSASYVGAVTGFSLQGYSGDGGAAAMSFHRGGSFAVNMGLDPDNVFRIGGWSAPASRLQMDMSGNLTMAGDLTAFSDIRVKKNIAIIGGALAKVEAIRGVTFERSDNDSGKRHAGVIAQEVEMVLPEVVSESADGTKAVAYGNMVGLLIEAVKELSAQNRVLTARLDAMLKE